MKIKSLLISGLIALWPFMALAVDAPAPGTTSGGGGTVNTSTILNHIYGTIISPSQVNVTSSNSSLTVDMPQGTANATVAVASAYGIPFGASVSGTMIPASTTVASIVGGSNQQYPAAAAFTSGQAVITLTATAGLNVHMQCVDLTNPSAIPAGDQITAVSLNASITLATNFTQNSSTAADIISCDPVLVLSNATTSTLSAGSTFNFLPVGNYSATYANPTTGYQIGGQTILSSPYAGTVGGPSLVLGIGAAPNILGNSIYSTVVGTQAGASLTVAIEDTFGGWESGNLVTTGSYDAAWGDYTMGHETTGSYDSAFGGDAMRDPVGLNDSTALGWQVLRDWGPSVHLTCGGFHACQGNATTPATGNYITAWGSQACQTLNGSTLNHDGCWGFSAGQVMTTASYNLFFGDGTGENDTTGSNNAMFGEGIGIGANWLTPGNDSVVGTSALGGGPNACNNMVVMGYKGGYYCSGGGTTVILGPSVASTTYVNGTGDILIGNSTAVDTPASNSSNMINIGNMIAGGNGTGTNPLLCTTGQPCILGVLRSANLNSTADQTVAISAMTTTNIGHLSSVTKYKVTEMYVTNCSTTTPTAVGGLYTAASKGGTALVASTQVYTSCTSATTMQDILAGSTSTAANMLTSVLTTPSLYFSLTTAEGAAETGDVYVVGVPFN